MTILNKDSKLYEWLANPNETQNLLLKFPMGRAALIEKKFPFGVVVSVGEITDRWRSKDDPKDFSDRDYYFDKKDFASTEENLVMFIWNNVLREETREKAIADYVTNGSYTEHIPNHEEY